MENRFVVFSESVLNVNPLSQSMKATILGLLLFLNGLVLKKMYQSVLVSTSLVCLITVLIRQHDYCSQICSFIAFQGSEKQEES